MPTSIKNSYLNTVIKKITKSSGCPLSNFRVKVYDVDILNNNCEDYETDLLDKNKFFIGLTEFISILLSGVV